MGRGCRDEEQRSRALFLCGQAFLLGKAAGDTSKSKVRSGRCLCINSASVPGWGDQCQCIPGGWRFALGCYFSCTGRASLTSLEQSDFLPFLLHSWCVTSLFIHNVKPSTPKKFWVGRCCQQSGLSHWTQQPNWMMREIIKNGHWSSVCKAWTCRHWIT